MSSPAPRLFTVALGTRPYAEALELQRAVARARITGAIAEDVLLLVQHPPVFTFGRSTKASSLPLPAEALRARGVEVYEIERGGDVTFHGPGQLVGYPIVDLKRHRKDLHWYLRQVEEAVIAGIAPFGVAGTRSAGYTGVWVGESEERRAMSDEGEGPAGSTPSHRTSPSLIAHRSSLRKLASIGVHARDWVTWHGFALNVTTEPLRFFDLIVPCGIAGVEMTSVSRELGRDVTVDAVAREVTRAFGRVFGLTPVQLTVDELRARLPAPEPEPAPV
jgi:lipoyl(octanoyl) transferase